jgi:hypothetical protein
VRNTVSVWILLAVASLALAAEPTPVLIELFTSEGCPNCPAAERQLLRIASEPHAPGARPIVIAWHVDSWNRTDWRDPYSSAEFTRRQTWYSAAWPLKVYTPQAVVDGLDEMRGGDGPAIVDTLRRSASRPKGHIEIAYSLGEGGAGFRLRAMGIAGRGSRPAAVHLVLVEDGLTAESSDAAHPPVARKLALAGEIPPGASDWEGEASVAFDEAWNRQCLRAVVFAQDLATREIIALGDAALSGVEE